MIHMEYVAPKTLEEFFKELEGKAGQVKFAAGCTNVIPDLRARAVSRPASPQAAPISSPRLARIVVVMPFALRRSRNASMAFVSGLLYCEPGMA